MPVKQDHLNLFDVSESQLLTTSRGFFQGSCRQEAVLCFISGPIKIWPLANPWLIIVKRFMPNKNLVSLPCIREVGVAAT